MSNIYIQEPPTNGKVLLITTAGDLDIELWSKEAPKACRNFVQLCMEGYYDGTIFHRVIKDFIVQGGDPTGTGTGGESIYGAPFKDEIHSRLRFVRRGLVAMANGGPNDNGSQFFFTMGPTQELQNKHTLFGKVTGNTIYNLPKLQEVDVDQDDRPYDAHRIKSTHILSNPFDDIIPRKVKEKSKKVEMKIKSKSKATKNYKLLSFGDEAEEQEEKVDLASKETKGKSKSSHDLIDDPSLSTEITEIDSMSNKIMESKDEVKEKVKPAQKMEEEEDEISRTEELRKEAKRLRKELKGLKEEEKRSKEKEEEVTETNEVIAEYKAEREKYKKAKIKKGGDREAATLAMLAKFKSKLESVKRVSGGYSDEEEEEEEVEVDGGDMSWMTHKLIFTNEERKRKVIDANVQELDRYEISDPRNPLTKRRREASKQTMKKQKT